MAKHGNRAASSRVGSAEVLEALGIPLDVPADRQKLVLKEAGIAFLFAPSHHPAMRHAGAARKELGIRTIFNVLGPLANPARVTRMFLGSGVNCSSPAMLARGVPEPFGGRDVLGVAPAPPDAAGAFLVGLALLWAGAAVCAFLVDFEVSIF